MKEEESFEIDNHLDWLLLETLLNKKGVTNHVD